MSTLSICVIWHVYELTRLQKYESSFFGKLLVAFSALSLICYFTRIIVVTLGSDPPDIDLFSESVISYATRWGVMASDVLTFMAINGYYMEKSWTSEKKYLSTELMSAKKSLHLIRN